MSELIAHFTNEPGYDPSMVYCIVRRFDSESEQEPRSDFGSYLPPAGPNRLPALVSLVQLELDRRFANAADSTDAGVQKYLETFPELASDQRTIGHLLRYEFELRRNHDATLTLQQFVSSRYPQYGSGVFDQIDELPSIPGYEVIERLGSGGMGVVYKARQLRLNRLVALKVLRSDLTSYPEAKRRFQTEAETAATLSHPNIVRIFEGGKYCGQQYICMELIECISLDALTQISVLDSAQAARVMATVARAIHHAHQRSVIHRDLKPANILVDYQFIPHVADFGLAKLMEGTAEMTLPGTPLGTPSYMAPEQAASARNATALSDVYGLGATLFKLLTGSPPFLADTPTATLALVQTGKVPSPRKLNAEVDRDLEAICLKSLQHESSSRYRSAEEFAEDLEHWLEGKPIRARPIGSWERTRKWAKRRPGPAALLGLSTFLVLLVAGWGVSAWQSWAETKGRVNAKLEQAASQQQKQQWPEALLAARDAEALLDGRWGHHDRRVRLRELLHDLNMVARLAAIRSEQVNWRAHQFDLASVDASYETTFREFGIDVVARLAAEAADQIDHRTIRAQLVPALADWFLITRVPGRREHLFHVLTIVDPDELRHGVRKAIVEGDKLAIKPLASRVGDAKQPPYALELLGAALIWAGEPDCAVDVLGRAQRQHPHDVPIIVQLARQLEQSKPPQRAKAVGYYRAAHALQPKNPGLLLNLSAALIDNGDYDEALAVCAKVIELDSNNAHAHRNLGLAYFKKESFRNAIKALRDAIDLSPRMAAAHHDLGMVFDSVRDYENALISFREAYKLRPSPDYQYDLGVAYDERAKELRQKKLYGAASLLYETAFLDAPKLVEDLEVGHRYNAACSAALTGCGQGMDEPPPTDQDNARWRTQGMEWLRADLAARKAQLIATTGKAQGGALKRLRHWQKDSDLAGLRDDDALANLPEKEQAQCRSLWAELTKVLATFEGRP